MKKTSTINKKSSYANIIKIIASIGFIILSALTVYITTQTQVPLSTRAWSSTTINVTSLCDNDGTAQIMVSVKNEQSKDMTAIATDVQTGISINLGIIKVGNTATGTIKTNKNNLNNSSVKVNLEYVDKSQSTTKTVDYSAISCKATSTNVHIRPIIETNCAKDTWTITGYEPAVQIDKIDHFMVQIDNVDYNTLFPTGPWKGKTSIKFWIHVFYKDGSEVSWDADMDKGKCVAPTPTATPKNTPTPPPTNTPGPTKTPTPTPTKAPTPTKVPIPTHTVTPTPVKPTATPTNTPAPTATPRPNSCGYTPCNTDNPCQAGLVCVQANNGLNFCAKPEYKDACINSPNAGTCCMAPTNTPTPTPTSTPVPTDTPVPTSTPTNTPTPSNTPTGTPQPTNTPTNTPTATNTPNPSATATNTPTPTEIIIATNVTNTPTPTTQGVTAVPTIPSAGKPIPWWLIAAPLALLVAGLVF